MNTYPIERRAANRLPQSPALGDALGLRTAVDAVLQHGRLALAAFVLVFGAALLYQLLSAPVFRADTVLEIDTKARSSLLPTLSSNDRGGATLEPQLIAGEMEVLRSREVMFPVIVANGADIELSGATRFGFLPTGARHGIDVVQFQVPDNQRGKEFTLRVEGNRFELADASGAALGAGELGKALPFKIGGGSGSIAVNGGPNAPRAAFTLRSQVLLKAYENTLMRLRMFEPSRESNVVRINYEDSSPSRAAALLNAMVERYVNEAVKRRALESEKALAYLENQLPPLQARVAAAEDALRAQQSVSSAAPFSAEAEAMLRQRTDLERQQVDLRVKRDQLSQTLTPQHSDLAAVIAQQVTVQRALDRVQDSVNQFPVQQRRLQPLLREVQISTQMYTAMLTHVQQLRVQTASGLPSAHQIDAAAVPVEAVRPRAAAVLSIGAGLGMLLALAAVLALRALHPTVADSHDGDLPASAPTLGVIPLSEAQARLMDSGWRDSAIDEMGTHRILVRSAPSDPAVESLRAIHLALMVRLRNHASTVIMVTSPSPGCGKGFIAANLAAVMAEAGKSVLLIDGDLRSPRVHKLVGLDEHAHGLSDVLFGERTIDEVVRRHASIDIDVILHGTVTENPGALLQSNALERVLATLRERYDHVVINGGALLPSGDAVAIGRLADATVMVVRSEHTPLRETQAAQRRLEQAGIKLDGILVNGAKRNRLNSSRTY